MFFFFTSSFRFKFASEISYHFLDSRNFSNLISFRFGFFLYDSVRASCIIFLPDAEYWNVAFGLCVVHTISWNYTSIITTIVCHFHRYYREKKYYPIVHVYICMNFTEKPSSCFAFLLVGSCCIVQILYFISLFSVSNVLYIVFFLLSFSHFFRSVQNRATVLSVKLTTCIEYSHNFHNNFQMFLDHMYAYIPLSDA